MDYFRKGGGKILRIRAWGEWEANGVSWHGRTTVLLNELIAAVAAYARSSQTAFQNGKARGYMTPPLELLTVVGFWGKVSQFSWRIWFLLSRLHSSGGSIHKNTRAAYTELSGLFLKMKRETKLGRNGDGSGRNRKKSGVNTMKNYMHIKKFSKNQ